MSTNEDLINAVKRNDLQIVKDTYTRLTSGKPDAEKKQFMNYQRAKDGKTALHLAYGLKLLEIAKFLIQNGADITVEDNDGDTPVKYMLNQGPPYDIALLEYTITLPNLDPEEGKDIAYILNQQLPVNTYKRLGMGSYGLVVSPSFKTRNNTKVTKFMFRKNSYDEILATMGKIQRNLPLLYTNTQPYPEQYTFSNIATNNAQVGKILRALNPRIKNTNKIYPLVMDNLGKAFNQITDADLPALAAIPIKTLLEQYRHLADTLLQLKDKEYIHGDIRETNVVINLQTGKITLIDFDWLYKVPEFKRQYVYQFYPHPPELIFAKEKEYYYKSEFQKKKTFKELKDNINARLMQTQDVYQSDILHTPLDISNGVLKSIYSVINMKSTNANTTQLPPDYGTNIQSMLRSSYLQIDSYGLGYSLAYFHRKLEKTKSLRPAEDAATIDAIKPWMYGLCDPSYVDRMSLETFRANIEGEYQRLFPPAPAPVPLTEPVVAPPSTVLPSAPKTRGRKKKAVTVVPPVNAVSVAASAPANVVPVVPMNVVPVAASAAILPTGPTGAKKTRGKKGKVKGGRRHTRRHTKRS